MTPEEITASTILLDLDDTLYPRSSMLLPYISARIARHLQRTLRIPHSQADSIRMHYMEKYGSTLAGLINQEHIDPDDFTKYVYDINYQQFIDNSQSLKLLLNRFKQRKIVYTNGARIHAEHVLSSLGVDNVVDGI
ncbi:MAG: hypothetical protein LBV09_04765, partial [Deferribacteraceae bacterium]|nr:hypothetical protein [Deferribacteraceae bacterium]